MSEVTIEEMRVLADWWNNKADELQQKTQEARTKAQQWYMRAESGEAIRKANGIDDP